jgi:hypothetical protein
MLKQFYIFKWILPDHNEYLLHLVYTLIEFLYSNLLRNSAYSFISKIGMEF